TRGLLRALGSSTISNRKIARRAGFNEILPCRSDSSAVGGGLSSVLTAFRNTVCSVSDTAAMTSESGTRARAPLTFARTHRPRDCRLLQQAACQEPANAESGADWRFLPCARPPGRAPCVDKMIHPAACGKVSDATTTDPSAPICSPRCYGDA